MEQAILHCKCGYTYRTTIQYSTLTTYPGKTIESANMACPGCGFMYRKELAVQPTAIRQINVTEQDGYGLRDCKSQSYYKMDFRIIGSNAVQTLVAEDIKKQRDSGLKIETTTDTVRKF